MFNFLQVLGDRDQRERLCELIEFTPYSRARYEGETNDPVELARRFFHRSNTSWREKDGVFNDQIINANGGGTLRGAWERKKANLLSAGKRLAKVTIESIDAIKCINRYDNPETLFYVDPPYLGERRPNLYRDEMMDEASHIRLAETLKACVGHVAVSGYPTPLYEDLYAGWQRHLQLVKPRSKESKLEVLWVKPNEASRLVGNGAPDLFGEHASEPKPRRKSNAAYVKNTLKRAAINPDNGEVLPRGRPKETGPVRVYETQEARARRQGSSSSNATKARPHRTCAPGPLHSDRAGQAHDQRGIAYLREFNRSQVK